MEHIKMGDDYCPTCKTKLDHATPLQSGDKPEPHDLSVCINCGEMLEFSDDFALVKLTNEVFDKLSYRTKMKLYQAQHHIQHLKK
jgi:hypothetical protein